MKLRVDRLDNQHRLLILLVALAVFVDMTQPALFILLTPHDTWTATVASITTFPSFIGWTFALSAFSMLPLLFFLAADCCTRKAFQVACFGSCIGSFACICLSYVSRHLDIGWFSLMYFANGTICLLFAAALAVFLHDQQAKRYEVQGNRS